MSDSAPSKNAPCRCCAGQIASIGKRASLKTIAGATLALGTALHVAEAAAEDGPRAGDWLVDVDADAAKPLGPGDLKAGAKQLIALPYDPGARRARDGSRLNRILLIKLDTSTLNPETLPRAADGVVAYSAICTHQACDVNSWRAKEQTLLCFCHFSQFRPSDGAVVVTGPAPRALPYLPLKTEDGRLVLAAGFSDPPGPA